MSLGPSTVGITLLFQDTCAQTTPAPTGRARPAGPSPQPRTTACIQPDSRHDRSAPDLQLSLDFRGRRARRLVQAAQHQAPDLGARLHALQLPHGHHLAVRACMHVSHGGRAAW